MSVKELRVVLQFKCSLLATNKNIVFITQTWDWVYFLSPTNIHKHNLHQLLQPWRTLRHGRRPPREAIFYVCDLAWAERMVFKTNINLDAGESDGTLWVCSCVTCSAVGRWIQWYDLSSLSLSLLSFFFLHQVQFSLLFACDPLFVTESKDMVCKSAMVSPHMPPVLI